MEKDTKTQQEQSDNQDPVTPDPATPESINLQPPETAPPEDVSKAKASKAKVTNRIDQKDEEHGFPADPPHLHMELQDPEIMGMDYTVVCRDLTLVNRGLDEFNRQHLILVQRKDQITKKMAEISKRSAALSKVQLILGHGKKQNPNVAVRAFQQRSLEQREARRANALSFIKQGTSPKAVQEMLATKSPIDRGFEGRKPGIGQGRPGQRVPARV